MVAKKSILIISSQDKHTARLRGLLGRYHLLECDRIDEAIRLSDENLPHLILIDLNLPLRTGFLFLEDKINHPRISKIPTIAIVEQDDQFRQLRGAALGAKGYIKRPYSPIEVQGKIAGILNESGLKKYIFPQENVEDFKISLSGTIKAINETSLVLDSPVKFAPKCKVNIYGKIFQEMNIDPPLLMKTDSSPSVRKQTGIFTSKISFVGLSDKLGQKLRKALLYWRNTPWNDFRL
jgi:CheY-like chemotaxis protein